MTRSSVRSIPITRPYFGVEELAAVQRPLQSGWVVQGPEVQEFERKFAAFTGTPHAVATSSCTTALHIAMAALELGRGDHVIVPAFTWVATANVVEYMGAKPLFCDIDLKTFNATASTFQVVLERSHRRTVGLLPVHLFGQMADMPPILELAATYGCWVVEDAACAFGASQDGRHAGTFGDAGCFSFHPRKSITTGEGGMVTTDRDDLDRIARSLRDHGASRSDYARHQSRTNYLLADYERLGYNFRMTDIQGAIGSVQMDRADWILSERRRCAEGYSRRLAARDWLQLPQVGAGMTHGYQSFVCLFAPIDPALSNVDRLHEARNALMDRLADVAIATRPGTHAAALQTYYTRKYGLRPEQFPNAYLADRLSISLPIFPQMTDEELDFVSESIDDAFAAVWRG